MRISCEAEVQNRLLPSLNLRGKKRTSRASLSVGTSAISKEKEHVIRLQTADYNFLYKIKYVTDVFIKFLKNGKATLRFCEPPHDIFINGDAIQLARFIRIVQALRDSKLIDPSQLSIVGVETPRLEKVELKLKISNQKDYPLTSNFPSSLQVLHINSCKLSRVDSRILRLKDLSVLDLSANSLTVLPASLTELRNLAHLNLEGNGVREFPEEYCVKDTFPSLVFLNMSENCLTELPRNFGNLQNLETLKLNSNKLIWLPSSLGMMRRLKTLTLVGNNLTVLPGSIVNLNLDNLEVNNNPFELDSSVQYKMRNDKITLLELCAKTILKNKLSWLEGDLPRNLVEYLHRGSRCCCCKNYYIDSFCTVKRQFDMRRISLSVSYDQMAALRCEIPLEAELCSQKCHNLFSRSF